MLNAQSFANNQIRQARLNSFEEDLRLTGNDFSVAVSILSVGFAPPYFHSATKNHKLTSSKLCPHASTIEHGPNQSATVSVHAFLGLCLVLHLCGDGWDNEFRWSCCRPILSWYRRSTLLPGMLKLPLEVRGGDAYM